jgi:hypothetical protein
VTDLRPIEFDIDDFADLDEQLPLLHDRVYRVRSYKQNDRQLRIRGMVRDQKPRGLYIADDPEPMTVHHMVIDLVVDFPSLVIAEAKVVLETHPHAACPKIEDHYGNLVGLSIARGFTHKVRELFGGPRGCTHTTALLQAMAPVAIQSVWSMRASGSGDEPVAAPRTLTPQERMQQAMRFNLNTCHIWDENGAQVAAVMAGEQMEIPVWAERRLREMGRNPDEWRMKFGQEE